MNNANHALVERFPDIEKVRERLANVGKTQLEVFSATGLTPSWQQAFKEGRVKDPSYTKTCQLIAWLDTQTEVPGQ